MLLELYCFSNRKPIKLQISMVDKGNDTGLFRNVRKSSHERLYDKRAEGDKAATKIVWVVEDKSAIDAREWQLVVGLDMVLPPWLSEIANVTGSQLPHYIFQEYALP